MSTCHFRSPLAFRLKAFLRTRMSAGRRSLATETGLVLLDRFLMAHLKPNGTLTRELVEKYCRSIAHLSIGTPTNRLSLLRQFSRYLSHFDPQTCLVHRSYLPRRTRPAPHIYTRSEICKIMRHLRRRGKPRTLLPILLAHLVGLLYTTGLRVGEALRLTLRDVDLKRSVLIVRQTKFNKSRYVPISPSCASHLQRLLRLRRQAGFSDTADAPLFVNRKGKPLDAGAFTQAFLQTLRALGLRGPQGQLGPRVHDLRHSFSVARLQAWYQQKANLYAKLPLLATYLGHTTISSTEVYLHTTAQLLEAVGRRFHAHFAVPPHRRTQRHVHR